MTFESFCRRHILSVGNLAVSSWVMVLPTHLDNLSKEPFPQYFAMCQITGPEDLLGIAGGGVQRFRATDVTAQNERFLWGAGSRRLGNTVTSPGE